MHLETEERTPLEQRAAMTWARRLKREFDIDITACGKCKGPVKVMPTTLAALAGQALEKILKHLKAREASQSRPSTLPPPPRASPMLSGWGQGLAD